MTVLRHFSLLRAGRDLRTFIAHRERHEIGFLLIAIAITTVILWAFVHDSHFERPYKREIQYVDSWPETRTDREIIAQQKIDSAARHKELAEIEARRAARQADFKRIDDKLKSWGI